ncbi:mucin-2-like isoform X1 [Anguilla anguilla]|uniref:mucin-2-like isoform X1 n=1 Tax=Anguilla anguilla TaxID=7936 RepID=UPI0015A81F75|nr:mucin-2-like isoform X1 [Anguilla anguilla]XP_035257461.1 mucin-2-like isoform X1 [Anguilla anguilla]
MGPAFMRFCGRYNRIMSGNVTRLFFMLLSLAKIRHYGILCDSESCPAPPHKNHTKPFNQTQIYQEDEKHRYACAEGFVRKAGTSAQIRCSRSGNALKWDDEGRPTALVCIRDPRLKPLEAPQSTPTALEPKSTIATTTMSVTAVTVTTEESTPRTTPVVTANTIASTPQNTAPTLTPTTPSHKLTPTGTSPSHTLTPTRTSPSHTLTPTRTSTSHTLTPRTSPSHTLTPTRTSTSHTLTPIRTSPSHTLTPIRTSPSHTLTPRTSPSHTLTPIRTSPSHTLTPTTSPRSPKRTSFTQKTTTKVQHSPPDTTEPNNQGPGQVAQNKTTTVSLGVIAVIFLLIALILVALRQMRNRRGFRLPLAEQRQQIPMGPIEPQDQRYIPVALQDQ